MDEFKIGDVGVYQTQQNSRKPTGSVYKLTTRFVYGKVIAENEVQYFLPFDDLDSYYKYLQWNNGSAEMPSKIEHIWSSDIFSTRAFVKIPDAFWLDDERTAAFLKLQGLGEEFGLE